MRLLSQLRKKRGIQSEERVQEALGYIRDNHSSVSDGDSVSFLICNFWQTKRLSQGDKDGVDFNINVLIGEYLDSSIEIQLQVKSSKRGATEHLQNHPDIPVIVVNPLVTDAQLKEKLVCVIEDAIRSRVNAVSSV